MYFGAPRPLAGPIGFTTPRGIAASPGTPVFGAAPYGQAHAPPAAVPASSDTVLSPRPVTVNYVGSPVHHIRLSVTPESAASSLSNISPQRGRASIGSVRNIPLATPVASPLPSPDKRRSLVSVFSAASDAAGVSPTAPDTASSAPSLGKVVVKDEAPPSAAASRGFLTHSLRRAAQLYPHADAAVCASRRVDYEQLIYRVSKLAGSLVAHGLQNDTRVAVLALNSDRYLEALYAVAWANAISVPVNVRLAATEMVHILRDCEVEFLFVDEVFKSVLPTLREKCPSIKFAVFTGDSEPPHGALAYEQLVADGEPSPDVCQGGDDIAAIFYTAGVSGEPPKGVMLSHNSIVTNAMSAVMACGFSHSTTYCHATPMYGLLDFSLTFAITFVGGAHVFIPRFEPTTLLRSIQQHRVSDVALYPCALDDLLECSSLQQFDLSTMRTLVYGGATCSETIIQKAIERLSLRFVGLYVNTECGGLVAALGAEWHSANNPRLLTTGNPLPHVDVLVVNDQGDQMAHNMVGHLVCRGLSIMKGYWGNPGATTEAFRGGWVSTGDLAKFDPDGFLHIVDRESDVMVFGSQNIYSQRIEAVILALPEVLDCAVVPADLGTITAIVVPRPGADLTQDAILQQCRAHLAPAKRPTHVVIRKDPLPRAVGGKGSVLKQKLRVGLGD